MKNILLVITSLVSLLYFNAQNLEYFYCSEQDEDWIEIDLNVLQADLEQQYAQIFRQDEAVYITESYRGILKVINPSTQPAIENFCNGIQGVESFYEIAINSQNEIYISSGNNIWNTKILRIDEQCSAYPISNNFPTNIQAMSFDKSDNLYAASSFGSSIVYRSNANDLGNFYPWHNFQQGTASGDFVEKDGYLYIAWNLNNVNYLYKVTVDNDNQYVSHENLGEIRDKTYGLANEYGQLYGVTPRNLYAINEETMEFYTVEDNPSNANNRSWWGAAGLHEAINIEYSFHLNESDANTDTNELSNPFYVNSNTNTIIYGRIENTTTSEFYIYPIEIIINKPPPISIEPNYTFCAEDGPITVNSGVDSSENEIRWYHNGARIQGENSSSVELSESGEYEIRAGNFQNNCFSNEFFTVEASFINITNVVVSGTNAITVNINGINPPYQYSLDDFTWQNSNSFSDLESGEHYVQVQNSLGCLSDKFPFIIGYSNTITPNNDGINDLFYFPYLAQNEEATFKIYDKYGKLLKQGVLDSGTSWDGHYLGRPLPTDTYWFIIERDGEIIMSDYIFIKNY